MRQSLPKIVRETGKLLSLSLTVFLMASCDERPMYEEYVTVSEKGWFKDSTVSFSVEIEDTTKPYQVVWYLRNNNQYPFSNIYLFRKVTSEQGIEFSDTAQYYLADAYGKWLGKGVGEVKTNTWPFKQQLLFFNEAGTYTFTLQQAMRTEYLKGVEDVGLGIYKVDTENNNGKEKI